MKSKKLLKFEFISQGSLGAGSGLAESFFEVIATRLGAGALLLAFISSSSYISNLLSPLWAHLARRYSVRNLVIFSLVMTSVFLLTGAMVKHPFIFSLVIFFYFIFYGIREVLYPVIVENTYETPAVLGHVEAVFNLFYLISVGVAGYIMDMWGFKVTFIIAAIAIFMAALSRIPFPNVPPVKEEHKGVMKILKDREIRAIVIAFMISGTGMLMMTPAIPILEVRVLSLTNLQIAILIIAETLSYILFSEFWARIVKNKRDIENLFIISFLTLSIMALIYFFSTSFIYLLLASILCGIGGSSIGIGWQSYTIINIDYRTEELSSLHLSTCGIRGLYAPFLGGFLILLTNVRFVFIVSSILIISGLIYFIVRRKNKR